MTGLFLKSILVICWTSQNGLLIFFPTILLFVYISCFITFSEFLQSYPPSPLLFLNTAIIIIIFQEFFHIFLIILSNSLLFIFGNYSFLFHGGYYSFKYFLFSSCIFCFFQILKFVVFLTDFHN